MSNVLKIDQYADIIIFKYFTATCGGAYIDDASQFDVKRVSIISRMMDEVQSAQ